MHKNKTLVSIVIILGFVILIGLGLLGYGLFKTVNDPNFRFFTNFIEKPSNSKKSLNKGRNLGLIFKQNILIQLAKDEWVHGITASMNKVIIHITNQNKQDRILIIDADNGSIVHNIKFQHRK